MWVPRSSARGAAAVNARHGRIAKRWYILVSPMLMLSQERTRQDQTKTNEVPSRWWRRGTGLLFAGARAASGDASVCNSLFPHAAWPATLEPFHMLDARERGKERHEERGGRSCCFCCCFGLSDGDCPEFLLRCLCSCLCCSISSYMQHRQHTSFISSNRHHRRQACIIQATASPAQPPSR